MRLLPAAEKCPGGDDPLTSGDNAVIFFMCPTITTGGFYLQYKLVTSPFIAYNAPLSAVQNALNAIDTMKLSAVTFEGNGVVPPANAVCASSTAVRIEFLQEFGQ
jgi:hypothetical protein